MQRSRSESVVVSSRPNCWLKEEKLSTTVVGNVGFYRSFTAGEKIISPPGSATLSKNIYDLLQTGLSSLPISMPASCHAYALVTEVVHSSVL